MIAAKTHRCPAAVRNAYRGKAKPVVMQQVREAARELGLPEPPAEATQDVTGAGE